MLTDNELLNHDALHARNVDLWFALCALRSVTGFMQSGAHPDDESSRMLAALRFRDGLSVAYVCATRGEGGQNDIGPEVERELGTLRTAEMERAADALDMRMWWLSESPDDTIFDFGFSKSGDETMAIWGRDRVLSRFVEVVRREKPDILMPTFLDVPGQHGHHRAMTEAARLVFDLAADPGYPGSALPVWPVGKLYLPAWSGAGDTYDDAAAPPEPTVTVAGRGSDPVTGWSWANIGERSRAFHRTQGMGHWATPDAECDWPLHLAASRVGADAHALTDNLPRTLADLGLAPAQEAIDAALAAWPDRAAVAREAARAVRALEGATVADEHRHRVERKRRELARVLWLASGASLSTQAGETWLVPGKSTTLVIPVLPGAAAGIEIAPDLPEGWSLTEGRLSIAPGAHTSDPYPSSHDPLFPARPALDVRFRAEGADCAIRLPLSEAPLVCPSRAAALQPRALVLNLARPAALSARLTALRPEGGRLSLKLPAGWEQDWSGQAVRILPPGSAREGLVVAAISQDGAPVFSERRLAYPHAPARLRSTPARLRVLAARIALPPVRVGYIGAGNDSVGEWLAAMGLDLRIVTGEEIAGESGIADIGALVVGVFGFRNPSLARAVPALHRWVRDGGTLVTLYHRPRDGWDPARTPPARIEIGSPSLHWRVTDQSATVHVLESGHPVLTTPNRIGPADWDGWSKERGLYFARRWDAVYHPLVAMADPGEKPLLGGLLSAQIGAGRHSHVALNLHHQMAALVPGAFRLMANLVAPVA